MTLVSLTLPDDMAEWAGWLERQIVGLQLSDLIDELKVINSAGEPTPALDAVMGNQREEVLKSGLTVLAFDRLRMLVRHPDLLLELQELVFIDGGLYWQTVPVDEAAQKAAEIVARRVKEAVANSSEETATPVTKAEQRGYQVNRRIYMIAVALAACVLLVFGVRYPFSPNPDVTFVWENPESLDSDLSPAEYGASLSKSLDEWWFSKPPKTKDELSARLRRFHSACQKVVAAEHPQLSDEQRTQLVSKCNNWLLKIDKHLADLDAGRESVLSVREDADETVRATIDALQQIFS